MEVIIYLLSLVSVNFIQCGSDIDYNGYYTYPSTEINICIKNDKEAMKKVIIHELGHYFYFNYLTEEEKNNWNKLYLYGNPDNIFSFPENFISIYAMENNKEDFAETFALIYSDNNYIDTGLLKLKVYYMKKLINKYLIIN